MDNRSLFVWALTGGIVIAVGAGIGGMAGKGGSSKTGGNAGVAGVGAAGGDGGSGGSIPDASVDVSPTGCPDAITCLSTQFCEFPSCTAKDGACVLKPSSCDNTENPVCGCNGLSYWNDCLRERAGVSLKHSGECGTADVYCGADPPQDRPNGSFCSKMFSLHLGCQLVSPKGQCWVMPATCPAIAVGSPWSSCSLSDECMAKCEAINGEFVVFNDANCPQ